jgi:hypothetical protein
VGSRARRRRLEQEQITEPSTPRLRIVGTTWRERGAPYRWRRFWYAVFLLFVTLVLAAPAGLALGAIWRSSHRAFWVVLPPAVAVVIAIAALEWWRSARRLRSDYSAASYRVVGPAVLIIGVGILFLPYGGWLVLVLVSVLLTGALGVQFLRACFDHELWPERELRLGGVSPSQRRWLEKQEGARRTGKPPVDQRDHPKTDSQVHPHE